MQAKRLLYSVGVLFVTGIALFVISIFYANRVADSARKDSETAIQSSISEVREALCVLINDIYQGQQEEPPQAESGKEFAKRIVSLRTRYACA